MELILWIKTLKTITNTMSLVLISHIIILIFLIFCAIASIVTRDLIKSVIIFGAYSFTMALTYSILRAIDVAMTEAAIGAGVSCILFIVAIMQTKRMED